MTTKKVNLDSIIHELLWFIRGDTNIRYLVQNGVNIWNDWPFQSWLNETGQADKYVMHSKEWKEMMKTFVETIITDEGFASQYGDLGPVYGKQWRDFEGVDQLKQVIEDIKKNPNSRRLIVSAWNPKDIPYLPATIIVGLMSSLTAKFGVNIAHRMKQPIPSGEIDINQYSSKLRLGLINLKYFYRPLYLHYFFIF